MQVFGLQIEKSPLYTPGILSQLVLVNPKQLFLIQQAPVGGGGGAFGFILQSTFSTILDSAIVTSGVGVTLSSTILVRIVILDEPSFKHVILILGGVIKNRLGCGKSMSLENKVSDPSKNNVGGFKPPSTNVPTNIEKKSRFSGSSKTT